MHSGPGPAEAAQRANHWGLACGGDIVRPDPRAGGGGRLWAIVQGRSAQGRSRAEAARLAALVVLTAAAGVAPWIVRNALVHGELVAIKSTFGYAFWQGNCALSEGTDKVVRASVEQVLDEGKSQSGLAALNRRLWAARHEAGYIDDIALTREDLKLLGSVSEPERSRILFRRAIDELRDRPGRYWQLCLRRFRYFWLFDETNPKTRVWVYRVSHLALDDGRPARAGARHQRRPQKIVADDRDRSLDRPLPYADHRLGPVSHSARAASGRLGWGGIVAH